MAKSGPDIGRLWEAVRSSRRTLQPFRQKRLDAVRQFVGRNYSDDGSEGAVPVNLLALYVNIVVRSMVSKSPRVMLRTTSREHRPQVTAMQSWMNLKSQTQGLDLVLQKIALDAIFSIGICKVALSSPAESALGGYNRAAGEPFAEKVDLDDWVHDTKARCFEECAFLGHRYRVPLDVVRESSLYSADRKKLEATESFSHNENGDERIGSVLSGVASYREEFEDEVELWEFYLPRRRLILTLHEDSETPLREREWLGPDCGPYHFLALQDVPGNAMPKSPIMDLIELHTMVNQMWRKLQNQAIRQKTVLGVASGAVKDGQRIIEANDGEAIPMDRPDSAREYRYGGPDPSGYAFAVQSRDIFSWLAGNLESLGGLGPQSGTLGQDQMLRESASGLITDLQEKTVRFTRNVFKALGWYWWHDPMQTMRTTWKLPGSMDISIERAVTPEQRQRIRWDELELDIDPYSLSQDTPQNRMKILTNTVMQIVLPALPLLEKQGVVLDMGAFLRKIATLANMPDLEEILSVHDAPEEEASPQPEEPGMPAQTTRRYERVNRPGATQAAKDQTLMNVMMGQNQQESQMAGMLRPNS